MLCHVKTVHAHGYTHTNIYFISICILYIHIHIYSLTRKKTLKDTVGVLGNSMCADFLADAPSLLSPSQDSYLQTFDQSEGARQQHRRTGRS